MNRQPSVYVVVLHWKNYAATRTCLSSLLQIDYPNLRVIVVDNHSEDGTLERLRANFGEFSFIGNSDNLGFSRGCNVGIRAAYGEGADYVLLLNNDMKVPPGFLRPAVVAAEQDSQVGLVTGKILRTDPPNVIWHAGGHIDSFRMRPVARGDWEVDRGQYSEICETRWASGAMVLIRRQVLETVGFLPEEYFFGVEEWDYSAAVLRAGYKILYVPDFCGLHAAGGSYRAGHPVLIVYNGIRNKMMYAQKHMNPLLWKLWRWMYWIYLQLLFPRVARAHCEDETDYRARMKAARLAFSDHKGIRKIEISELEEAARLIGPTTAWGSGWPPVVREDDQSFNTTG